MRRLLAAGLTVALVLGSGPVSAQDAETIRAAGAFEPAGETASERSNHATAALPDGRVLVVGSEWFESVPAEVWDPASGGFSASGTPLRNRARTAAVALPDGRVLVIGGADDQDRPVRFAELWDPESGTFTKAARLAEPRHWNDAALLPDGRVVVVGGYGRRQISDTIEVWDPDTGEFSKAGKLPEARWGQTTTVLPDGRVLIVGGHIDPEAQSETARRRGPRYIKRASLWDPATGSVSAAGKLQTGRADHAAALLPDGRVLIVGGGDWDRDYASAEIWDPATETFSEAGSMAAPRLGPTATTLPDGRILIVGGGPLSAEIWDPVTGRFTLSGPMLHARSGHTADLLPDGRVLIIGGESEGADSTRMAELWDPTKTYAPAAPASLALAACASEVDLATSALSTLFPATLQGVDVEVLACRGPDWLAMHDAADPDTAATIERTDALLASAGATIDDLTIAAARHEGEDGVATTITALQVEGAQASRFEELAVPLLLGIERPEWSGDEIGPGRWVRRVRDEATPGSEPAWIYAPTGDTLWIVTGAERELLADIFEALPGPGGRFEVPELGVAITFREDWQVYGGPDFTGYKDLGPETVGWSVASGEGIAEDDPYPGSCGLGLYLPTDLTIEEAMGRLVDEGDFAQPGPLEDGLYGYVGPYKLFDADIEMGLYGLKSGDAFALLLCLSERAPEDHWRSIVDSIELVPVDEEQWRPLLEAAESEWMGEEPDIEPDLEDVEATPEPTPGPTP